MVSVPIDRPSTKNSTERTPAEADADAVTVTVPRTWPPVGEVMDTDGPEAAYADPARPARAPTAAREASATATGRWKSLVDMVTSRGMEAEPDSECVPIGVGTTFSRMTCAVRVHDRDVEPARYEERGRPAGRPHSAMITRE